MLTLVYGWLDASEYVYGCNSENANSHPNFKMLVAVPAGQGHQLGNERVDADVSGGGNESEGTHCSSSHLPVIILADLTSHLANTVFNPDGNGLAGSAA